jgi:exosortase A-associated hydrolase 2
VALTEAFFLPFQHGARFCVLHQPKAATLSARGSILFVHAFAEEMNKSRRMAALQARAFANAGWIVLQIDLYGCGDSAGDFGDASWRQWRDDVIEAAGWLRAKTGHQPVIWSMRAGCLLATHAAYSMRPAPDLVFWQPATSGKQFLQQFLRLKVANQILSDSAPARGGTQQLREQLARGERIEIAGYALSPGLALEMEVAELKVPESTVHTAWLEVSGTSGSELSPAALARIQAWRTAGRSIDARVVTGPAFWQTLEIEECPELINATLSILEEWQK